MIKITLRPDQVADIQLALKQRICGYYTRRHESSGMARKLLREAIETLRKVNNHKLWETTF
jgi:hypothetical protein